MNIHYQIAGSGRNVILLHGWGQNCTMMNPLQQKLKEHYRVASLDLFGFGESEAIENYDTFDDYVETFHQFVLDHELTDPILIAHSFGARLAIRYALKYSVSAMILTGAAGIKPPLTWQKRWRQTCHKLSRWLPLPKSKGSYDYQHADAFQRKVLVQVVNEDLTPVLEKIKVPVLLIWGECDDQTPLWMGKKMEALMPAACLIVLEQEDHFAYYHQSGRFCAIVSAFLEGWCLS